MCAALQQSWRCQHVKCPHRLVLGTAAAQRCHSDVAVEELRILHVSTSGFITVSCRATPVCGIIVQHMHTVACTHDPPWQPQQLTTDPQL